MADFLVQVVFSDIDLDQQDVVQALGEVGLATAEPIENSLVRLTSVVDNDNAVSAAHAFLRSVVRSLPTASPVRIDRDLVSTTDIAERVGVTREAVRHWSTGRRRSGEFPTPVGTPSGSSIWEWSSVHAWLRHNLGIWDGFDLPNPRQFSQIDADIERFNGARKARSRAQAVERAVWVPLPSVASEGRIAAGRQVLSSREREHWSKAPVESKRELASVA